MEILTNVSSRGTLAFSIIWLIVSNWGQARNFYFNGGIGLILF
jgi:hypothetical protein